MFSRAPRERGNARRGLLLYPRLDGLFGGSSPPGLADGLDRQRLGVRRQRAGRRSDRLTAHFHDGLVVMIINTLDRHRLTRWLAAEECRHLGSVHRRIAAQ